MRPVACSKQTMNIEEVMATAVAALKVAGIAEPRLEAVSLLSFVLERDRTFLHAHPEHVLSDSELNAFHKAVERRSGREPLQYITGRQEFWRLEFIVTPDVLIPRPETEILVEAAIELLADLALPAILRGRDWIGMHRRFDPALRESCERHCNRHLGGGTVGCRQERPAAWGDRSSGTR